ncbi:MAG: class C beta-lactamase [Ramlibacter sp.]
MSDMINPQRRALLGTLGALAVPALALPACAQRTPASSATLSAGEIAAAVDAAYRPLLQAHAIDGMVVGIVEGGRSHFFSYGVASRASPAPATPDTLFELGSLSKTFTATLACHAQASGRLALTDTPGKHLPALRGSPIDQATLLHFGTYTAAGLPLQFPDAVQTDAAAIAWLRSFQPTVAPGTVRQYSNPSIGLMGHAAAAALGKPYATLCDEELFPALGLQRTFVQVPARFMAGYAWGVNHAGQPVRVNPGAFAAEAYGVKSTARDMLRFVQAQMQPGALPAPLRSALAQTQVPRYDVGAMVQGLGWEQYPWPSSDERMLDGNSSAMALQPQSVSPLIAPPWDAHATVFNKTGSTNGFGAYAAFIPGRHTGLVMLANRNFPNTARVSAAHAVLTALAPG